MTGPAVRGIREGKPIGRRVLDLSLRTQIRFKQPFNLATDASEDEAAPACLLPFISGPPTRPDWRFTHAREAGNQKTPIVGDLAVFHDRGPPIAIGRLGL